MSKNHYFKLIASAITACVLLVVLFLLFAVGLSLSTFASYMILLMVVFIGCAEIFILYHSAFSARSASLLLPYKLLLFTVTKIFAAVEIVLIFAQLTFNRDGLSLSNILGTVQLEMSMAYVLISLFIAVIYIAVMATIFFFAYQVKAVQDEEHLQKISTREVASYLTHAVHQYSQLSKKYSQQLDFKAMRSLFEKLSIKSRSLGMMGRSGFSPMEHDVYMQAQQLNAELESLLAKEQPSQDDVNEIVELTSTILDTISIAERNSIK